MRWLVLPFFYLSVVTVSTAAHAQSNAPGAVSTRHNQTTQQALQDLIGIGSIERREAALYAEWSPRSTHQKHVREASLKHDKAEPADPTKELAASPAQGPEPASATGVLPGLPNSLVAVVEGQAPPKGAPPAAENARGMSPRREASPAPDRKTGFLGNPGPVQSGGEQDTGSPVAIAADVMHSQQPADSGLFLPFERGVGAAAFRSGRDVVVVFDAARPLDLSAIQGDPLGAGSSIQLLPEATLLRLPGHRGETVSLRRLPAGWLVREAGEAEKPIIPVRDGMRLRLPVEHPGRTVTVPDPVTGGNLLVGTLRDGGGAMRPTRRDSAATIEQSFQGVVINPLCDRLELQATEGAFILSGMPQDTLGTASSQSIAENGRGAPPLRVMSLDAGSDAVLVRRLRDAQSEAAAAPATARFRSRLHAAEAAIALGEGVEAGTLIHVALADDPRTAAALRPRLIASAAALLNHQAPPPSLLQDPRLADRGEPALWRAVMLAETDTRSAEAARLFAANMAVLAAYPQPLQVALLPLAAETLVRAGTEAQAAMVARLPGRPSLAFARALLNSRDGKKQAALSMLDTLAASPDWVLGDKAAEEAARIRRNVPGSDLKKLADRLDARLLDARIAGHEADSLLYLADLRADAGQWQKALNVLRELAARYPAKAVTAHRLVAKLLERLMTAPAGGPTSMPLDEAALIEGNADMLPSGPEGVQVSLFLADKLAALDLPEQAAPIVQRLMQASDTGSGRAELGARLAALDIQQNDFVGAESALRGSDADNLASTLTESRAAMMARALAGQGKLDQALATLAPLHTDAALDFKATLLVRHRDWTRAAECLTALVRQRLPASGKLDPAGQDLLLRLASAASQTGDPSHLEQARALGQGRFVDPGKQALFELLTSDPRSDGNDPTKQTTELSELRHPSAIIGSVAQ